MAASNQSKRPVLASVLDRLLDDEPEAQKEAPQSPAQLMVLLRDAVRRDLENFFNTRQRCEPVPESMTELAGSLLCYGIPDLTGANLSSPRRRLDFLRSLETALRAYEPRFKKVKITALGSNDPADRSLRFRIDALLKAEPAPESVMYDSHLEPVSRSFSVTL